MKRHLARSLHSFKSGPQSAFTLLELLVVVAVLALLGMRLLPALARAKPDTRAFQCLNNHRQLVRAWRMYSDDNNDRLAPNYQGSPTFLHYPVWAMGWLDQSSSADNTNSIYLTDPRYSALALYCGKDGRLFKCPADQFLSPVQRARGWKERVRSISENLYVGEGNVESGPADPAYFHVKKWTELVNPKPADTWLSMDEDPYSINDGGFYAPNATSWINQPASYHDGGAGVAFADGRAEIHRWQGSLIGSSQSFTPQDPDLLWVRNHTPRKADVN